MSDDAHLVGQALDEPGGEAFAGGTLRVRPGSAATQSLDAQAALLPYALAAFAVGLPIFGWVCSFADDRAWMAASLVIFAINWAGRTRFTGALYRTAWGWRID